MYQLILSTCPNEASAKTIAKQLVKEQLVACVNIIPAVTSVYMWENELNCDQEVLMLLKSKAEKFEEISSAIEKIHPYEVAEIIAVDIEKGNHAYLNWLNAMVN